MTDRDSFSDYVETAKDAGYKRPLLTAIAAWVVGWGIRIVERRPAANWTPEEVNDQTLEQQPPALWKGILAFVLTAIAFVLFSTFVDTSQLGPSGDILWASLEF